MGTPENTMSPESTSSLFPDRPIRPLPKRRLRERLSPDVADSIQFPPTPQTNSPLFVYPFSSREESPPLGSGLGHAVVRDTAVRPTDEPIYRRNGTTASGQEDDAVMSQTRKTLITRGYHEPRTAPLRYSKPPAPPSTASSVDGYDSFENTNNKKKRKIPIAGEMSLNASHALNEPNGLGIPSSPVTAEGDSLDVNPTSTPYYQNGGPMSNAQGISGPGRGRYGRIRNGRSPLRAISDSNGNWTGRNMKLRNGHAYPSPPAENSGIISTAIASAEKLPLPSGQENISLLHQQASTKPTPTPSAQFTFTFGSENPISWPGSDPAPRMPTRTYQSAPADYQGMVERAGQYHHAAPSQLSGNRVVQADGYPPSDHPRKSSPNATAGAKKTRRRPDPLVQAAEQRRRDTEIRNAHNPPAPEARYMCEFCEYEMIFGHKPAALIRQYEIKDRQRRQGEAERRRLLEKAKMKSRKGKKTSKGATKSNDAAADGNSATTVDSNVPPPPPGPHDFNGDQNEALDSEDHYEDGLVDGENLDHHSDEVYSQQKVQETQKNDAQCPGGGASTISV